MDPPSPRTSAAREAIVATALARHEERRAERAAAAAVAASSFISASTSSSAAARRSGSRRARFQRSIKNITKRVLIQLPCFSQEDPESDHENNAATHTVESEDLSSSSHQQNQQGSSFSSIHSQETLDQGSFKTWRKSGIKFNTTSGTRSRHHKNSHSHSTRRSRQIPKSTSTSSGFTFLKRSTTLPPRIPAQEFSAFDLSPEDATMPEDDRYPQNPLVPKGLENYDVTFHPTRRPGAWTGVRNVDSGARVGEGSGGKGHGGGVGDGEGRGSGKNEGVGEGNGGATDSSTDSNHKPSSISSSFLKGEVWLDPDNPGPTVTYEFEPEVFTPAASAVVDFAYPPGHPLRHGPMPSAVHVTGSGSAASGVDHSTGNVKEEEEEGFEDEEEVEYEDEEDEDN